MSAKSRKGADSIEQKKMAQPLQVAPNPPKEEGGGDKLECSIERDLLRCKIKVLIRE
jgi:hypothetical protein